ncbi:MAG: FAD-binding oxidoreductase [Cyanobacteria bacterium P01_D01_bin.1]
MTTTAEPSTATLIAQLSAFLGEDYCIPWQSVEPDKQRQIAKATVGSPICLALPGTVDELSQVMALAAQRSWRVLQMGQASKLGWGGLAKETDIALSTARLNRIVDHAIGDFTVTVESGTRLADLAAVLAKEGQFLAVDPAFADTATVGGIVATADTGALRQRYGGLRDMLIGVQFVRYDGQLAKAGGRVVKNVAGYDLMKLMTGSYGTLGILSELTFRLYPVQAVSRTIVLDGTVAAVANAAAEIRLSGLTPVAFDIVLAESANREHPVNLVARFQGIAAGVEEQSERLEAIATKHQLAVQQLDRSADAGYWQQAASWVRPNTILCKVGMKPSAITPLLEQLLSDSRQPGQAAAFGTQARLQGSSGLGWVQWEASADPTESVAQIELARSHCQQNGGFLSLLQAPAAIKKSVDVWGYTGNALQVMIDIKQKFDPQTLLSPGRFVGGI